MVIVNYKAKGMDGYKKESFVNPQHYMKWRECMGKKLVDVRPVRSGRVARYA